MNRRDFFKTMSDSVVPAGQSTKDITTHKLEPTASAITPGSPRQYKPKTQVFIANAQAWLCCDDLGFYAIDAHCSHLGCLTRLNEHGYTCPCHESHFNHSGKLESGPAKQGLRYLYVDLDKDGNLLIRRDKAALPHDRLIA